MKTARFTSDELNARVLRVILDVRPTIDNRLTKAVISREVFGEVTQTTTRKVRDAVNELRKQGHPIISTTDGTPGYWYDQNDVNVIIGDYQSRIVDMSDTIRALKRGPEKVTQMELAI
jgi:hypothetical protein